MKSLIVKPWPLGELFLALLNGRIVLGLWVNFFGLGLCFLCLSPNFFGLSSVLGFRGGLSSISFILGPLALIPSFTGSF